MSELVVAVRLPLERFDLALEFTTAQPVTGLFGPSGAGKTSLLEVIAGLRRGAVGRVELDGEVWLDSSAGCCLPPERRHVGYVPQDGLLFPHLDVRHNLLAGAGRARRAGQDPTVKLHQIAALLELTSLLKRPVRTLSGGERQRVALGRALCSAPRLLLLDEPLAALDLPLRRRLLPLLARVREELTVPMLLVSHDPSEVQALCDDLIVLRAGQLIARGEPRSVLTDPAVFPLAAEQDGYENLLTGTVLRHQDKTSQFALGAHVELRTRRADAIPGSRVLIGLPASEILIATTRPQGLSARNILPARVQAIRPLERLTLIIAELAADLPPLSVEVNEATPGELNLLPGREVYLVIKATSCRLYGESA